MTISFASLGISETRAKHLETLGFQEPTEIQAQAIPHLLAGRDVAGQAQTGTGKTAAFALPILDTLDTSAPGVQALILTPTRELAVQVTNAFRELGGDRRLRILSVYGGQSIERQVQRLEQGVHIVVGTPGRIIDMLGRQSLKLDHLKWLVWAISMMWSASSAMCQTSGKWPFSRRRWIFPSGSWCKSSSTIR